MASIAAAITTGAPTPEVDALLATELDAGLTTGQLVVALGELLQSDNDAQRLAATTTLASSLLRRPQDRSDAFIDYLCSRLLDAACLAPLLTALMELFPATPSADVVAEVVDNLTALQTQLLPKETRLLLYRFLLKLLPTVTGEPVLLATAHAIELERDPDCLLLVFRVIQSASKSTALSYDSAALLFDCASAYFPILYPPRGNEELRIRLTLGILECFASAPLYATLAIPFLVDKLESELPSIQLEALKALRFCLERYSSDTTSGYTTNIWTCFEQNVATCNAAEVVAEATEVSLLLLRSESSSHHPVIDAIRTFCFRMITETDPAITHFVLSVVDLLTRKSTLFFSVFAHDFCTCFAQQFDDLLASPDPTNELNLLTRCFDAVLAGQSLLPSMNAVVPLVLQIPLTPRTTLPLTSCHLTLALLHLVPSETETAIEQRVFSFIATESDQVIPLLSKLILHGYPSVSFFDPLALLSNLEILPSLSTLHDSLFKTLLLTTSTLPSPRRVPTLLALLDTVLPLSCCVHYITTFPSISSSFLPSPLDPLFPTLLSRLSRLHSLFTPDQLASLLSSFLSLLSTSPRSLLFLPTLLPYVSSPSLLPSLLSISSLDSDTLPIYSFLIAPLTPTCPPPLLPHHPYFPAFLLLHHLSTSTPPSSLSLSFLDSLLSLSPLSLLILSQMISLSSSLPSSSSWRLPFFSLLYPKFISTFPSLSLANAPLLLALLSLLPPDQLSTHEHHLLDLFALLAPSDDASSLSSLSLLLTSVLPVFSQYPLSLFESSLPSFLPSLLAALSPPKHQMALRANLLNLLNRIAVCYPDAVSPYKHDVLRALDTPLDDPKRSVRAAAARCRCAWEALH